MKSWLYILLYLILIIAFLMLLALTSRMHVFLAIPTIVITSVVVAVLLEFLDSKH